MQRFGTAKVGAMFGPLTLIWFAVLAVLGVHGIPQAPEVLLAVNPLYAVDYFLANGLPGYFAIYAVFLAATGGGALYADLGHFGRYPIRVVWVLHYGFMQGPNVPSDLADCARLGLELELDKVHYFTGHVDMLAGRKRHGMVSWRDRPFARMAANTQDATVVYQVPATQTMQVGVQVGI